MRKPFLTALIAGALSAAPLVAFGQTSTAKAPANASSTASQSKASQPAAKSAAATTHATRGVVKSINDSTLVITRRGKNAGEMTLALNSSTHREGTIAVGTPVSVRYMHEGKDFVATAITAQQPKAAAATAKPSASSASSSAPKAASPASTPAPKK